MSLRLRQAIPGRPRRDSPSALAAITTVKGSYFVYPSSSNVVLLDPDGDLHDTLPFWDALPHRAGPSGSDRDVGGVLAREDLVLAWSGIHVVLWTCGAKGWSVHSTIVANAPVASLDFWSGTLALGTQNGVELWRRDPTAEVVVWDRIWAGHTEPSPMVALPPEKSHVAWYFKGERTISIQAFGAKGVTGEPQALRQPREIEWMAWRTVATSDPQLYVITTNGVLRIYATVLDDPSWFQLVYAMDYRAFRDAGVLPPKGKGPVEFGAIWVPDGATLRKAAKDAHASAGHARLPQSVAKILDALEQDEADVVVWFGPHGEVVLRSILNLDRAPPTLIKSEPLASFETPTTAAWSSRGCLLQGRSLFLGFPPGRSEPDVSTLRVSLLDLFAGSDESFECAEPVDAETMSVLMTQDISSFVRTPNGRGLLAIGEGGEIGVWEKRKLGKMARKHVSLLKTTSLVGKGQWMAPASPILYSIYAKGRGIASYYNDPKEGPRVVLQHLDPGNSVPTEPVVMPHFSPKPDDKIVLLQALSDIDDGYSSRKRRTRRAVIMAVAASGEAWVWRIDPPPTSPRAEFSESPIATAGRRLYDSPGKNSRRATLLPDSPTASPKVGSSTMSGTSVYHSEKPIVTLISHSNLPVEDGKKPRFILPVDPMGWHSSTIDWETDTPLQDMVVTLSEAGVLEFWMPRLGQHLAGQRRTQVQGDECSTNHSGAWMRTSIVRTEKTHVKLARTSSRKKTAIVCETGDGFEVTIWDSTVSEFSTGLELTHTFERSKLNQIQDLDWTTTSDLQSVLAIGFPHHVVLVCEQRMSYVDVTPGWAPFLHIDMRKYTSVPINDSIWIAGGSLAVGAGNQVYIFSRFLQQATPQHSADATPDEEMDEQEPEDIFQLIAHENGPLFDFHPTMLHQCLMWDKIDLVKSILVTLVKDVRKCEDDGRRRLVYQRLDPLDFHQTNTVVPQKVAAKTDYSSLFSAAPVFEDLKDEDEFTPALVQELIERLDGPVFIPLDQNDKSSLAALAQSVVEVEESRRSLDICGLRYLISIRTFANRDRRAAMSGAATPLPIRFTGADLGKPKARSRISFRNIVWATHSESHQVLLQAATASCDNHKMMWEDAKRLGVFLWMRSQERIRAQLEVVARNRFMADENRDPTSASLFFFALGKKQVVHGLWRQAPGHPEQQLMLKFLANDFALDRWKTAAMKNAYALLSKQRYEYAAAFFMLADSPKDAITVCLRQLNDWQLALAIARAVEGDGPLLRWILTDTVLPIAFSGGHRWLASWALWMLNRRDLSVRVIVSPMEEVAGAWDEAAVRSGKLCVGQPDNDDPSLLLLFRHLRSKTLQTAKGTSEITPKLEFDFVVHNARVFWRMGCHPLGLDVLRSWSFERPWFPPPKRRSIPAPISTAIPPSVSVPGAGAQAPTTPTPVPASPLRSSPYTPRRRSSFMLSRPVGRDNLLMDMDVVEEGATEPPTRVPSPSGGKPTTSLGLTMSQAEKKDSADGTADGEAKANGKATPNLMKGLRNDVQQGAAEFDMDKFFGGSAMSSEPTSTSPSGATPSTSSTSGPGTPDNGANAGGVAFNLNSFGGSLAPNPPKVDSISPGASTPAKSGTGTPAATGKSTPNKEPRKGISLMKEANAHAQADQGGAEFSFDSFFPGEPAAVPQPQQSQASTTGTSESVSRSGSKSGSGSGSEPQADGPKAESADSGTGKDTDKDVNKDSGDSNTTDADGDNDADDSKPKDEGKAAPKKDGEALEPRKGVNLMKDLNPTATQAQGAADFNMDDFGF